MPIFVPPFIVRRVPMSPPLYAELQFGVTVMRIAGEWVEAEFPTYQQESTADLFFRGGCVHTIDDDTAAVLTAAGYEVTP